jgi:XRE family transcriptional regulator, fatty acid utilization regulator
MDELRRIRKERGLSQQRLADLANVDKVTIVHIENGKTSPKVETLEKLASALGVELADLFPKAQAPLPLEEGGARSQPRPRSSAEPHLTIHRPSWEHLRESVTEEQLLEIMKGVEDGRIDVEFAVRQVRELYEEMA